MYVGKWVDFLTNTAGTIEENNCKKNTARK